MNTTQTHLMYIAIIMFSTASIWIAENVNMGIIHIEGIRKRHTTTLARIIFIPIAYLILLIPLLKRTCGIDTPVYYFDYSHDRIQSFDIMFSYLLMYLHRYILDPKVGLGIVSVITVVLSVSSIIRLRERIDVTLAFFAYVTCIYFFSYNYMRMLFAVSFVFIGYSFCINDKRKLAIIPFAIAPLFHLSAIIVLIIHIALLNLKKHKGIVITLGVIGLLAFMAKPMYFFSLINVERYSSQIIINQHVSLGIGTIVRMIPIAYFLWEYNKEYRQDYRYMWLVVFTFANVIFSFLGYFVGSASRISNAILVFQIIYAVPLFVKEDENIERRETTRVMFLIYCIWMYYIISKNFETMAIVPYY